MAERRASASEARAALQSLVHEAELRRRRQESIAADIRLWTDRTERAARALEDLGERLERAQEEHQRAAGSPRHLPDAPPRPYGGDRRRRKLKRKEAADHLADAETNLAETDRTARAALEALSAAREARAGSQARHEAAVQRLSEITHSIAETLETTPAGLIELAGLKDGVELPSQNEIEFEAPQPQE